MVDDDSLTKWLEEIDGGMSPPVEEKVCVVVESFVPQDQAQEGHHEKPMSPWAADAGDIGDIGVIPSLKFEGIQMEQGSKY